MKISIIMLSLITLAGCASTNGPLATQESVDLQKYKGVWYEQAKLPNRFQEQCVGNVAAEYTLQSDNRIKVVNSCKLADGSTEKVEGEGRLADKANPDTSKLEVRFAPKWLSAVPSVWGDYWIMKTQGNYEYSLVGTPNREFLWVLSRDKKADQNVVSSLLKYAAEQGFDVSKVQKTSQK